MEGGRCKSDRSGREEILILLEGCGEKSGYFGDGEVD